MADIIRFPPPADGRSALTIADVPHDPAVLIDRSAQAFTIGVVPTSSLFAFAIDARRFRVDVTASTHPEAVEIAYRIARSLGGVDVIDKSLRAQKTDSEGGPST